METKTEIKQSTKVFNVIILDKSGSMSSIAKQAIDGVNESIAAIKSRQEKPPEQDHVLTLTSSDYQPCCMTPLYDAMGNTITALHRIMEGEKSAIASVTIITDGYENASREFSHKAIRSLVEAYKNEGWLFAYIGADHDVESVAFGLAIDNRMRFEKTNEGTRHMFNRFQACLGDYVDEVAPVMSCLELDDDEKKSRLRASSKGFFKRRKI